MPARILVVDDDPDIRTIVEAMLVAEGYIASTADSAAAARSAIRHHEPDLVILDIMMESRNTGYDLCRELRKSHDFPILFLTARATEIDAVVGLDLGADDYVTKPFATRELAARVRALLRRTTATPTTEPEGHKRRWEIAEFEVDEQRLELAAPGGEETLSRIEILILRTLASNVGAVFTREEIMESVYGSADGAAPRTVDSHMRRLRNKMNAIGTSPIETVRGVGYRLVD